MSSLDAFLVRNKNIDLRPGGRSPEVKFLSVDVFSRQAFPYERIDSYFIGFGFKLILKVGSCNSR